MLISIVIPAYNDSKSIEKLVEEVDSITKKITDSYEIIVLDDGSKDDTKKVVLKLANQYKKLKFLIHEKNKGYGRTLKTLYENSKGDFVINLPGDNQIPAENITRFMKVTHDKDVVIGYRKKRMDSIIRKIYSLFYNVIISILANRRVHDVDSAKRVSRKLLKDINLRYENAFLDTELVLKSIFNGYKIDEIIISHKQREYGKGSGGNPKIIFSIIYSLVKFLFYKE